MHGLLAELGEGNPVIPVADSQDVQREYLAVERTSIVDGASTIMVEDASPVSIGSDMADVCRPYLGSDKALRLLP